MTDYKPIPCEDYARYEAWILCGQRLRLAWRDERGETHLEQVRPLDLQTRNHAEYLVMQRSGGGRVALRLDKIVKAQEA